MITSTIIKDIYNCELFNNFPNLGLSLDAIMLGLLHDNLWQKTGLSGSLNVKNFVAYHDTDNTDYPILYVSVRYPYQTDDTLCIVLESTRLSIIKA